MARPQNVAILGASNKPDRYAYKAFNALKEHGHETYLINPRIEIIDDTKVYSSLNDLDTPIDTLTIYLSPQRLEPLVDDIIKLKPQRVIFNPGTESSLAQEKLSEAKIDYEEACTLVLLSTKQFKISD